MEPALRGQVPDDFMPLVPADHGGRRPFFARRGTGPTVYRLDGAVYYSWKEIGLLPGRCLEENVAGDWSVLSNFYPVFCRLVIQRSFFTSLSFLLFASIRIFSSCVSYTLPMVMERGSWADGGVLLLSLGLRRYTIRGYLSSSYFPELFRIQLCFMSVSILPLWARLIHHAYRSSSFTSHLSVQFGFNLAIGTWSRPYTRLFSERPAPLF